ncbi:MAG: hybrid sensor histidine kinase/response regulator [Deltaproteobacteria bacterium]|nr:hybrid sensor histidine kinase/response regulator [Deltaproteobacteria bacterium]
MNPTLLLVDDERDNLEPMRVLLQEDYCVLCAESGARALEVLEREEIQLIIADQRMPGMTGVELLTRVRELYPEIVRLVLTAYNDFESMLKAINEGRVYRYIIKPWDVDDMRLTIRQALEWRELRITQGKLAADLSEAHRSLAQRTRELERAHETIVRQKKLAAVGRFAAEMVHEMNNCLQVILGLGKYLKAIREEELEQIRDLEAQATSLAELTTDIRDYAQGAGAAFHPERVDPALIVQDVVRTCKHHPDFRGLELALDSREHAGDWSLDPRQLKHLLMNLLRNAAKASQASGAKEVQVSCRVGDALELRVVDHGPGVPGERRERIFEPFFSTWERDGTGLGLSICRRVADLHGAEIEVQDTPGGGATFVVRVPAPSEDD